MNDIPASSASGVLETEREAASAATSAETAASAAEIASDAATSAVATANAVATLAQTEAAQMVATHSSRVEAVEMGLRECQNLLAILTPQMTEYNRRLDELIPLLDTLSSTPPQDVPEAAQPTPETQAEIPMVETPEDVAAPVEPEIRRHRSKIRLL